MKVMKLLTMACMVAFLATALLPRTAFGVLNMPNGSFRWDIVLLNQGTVYSDMTEGNVYGGDDYNGANVGYLDDPSTDPGDTTTGVATKPANGYTDTTYDIGLSGDSEDTWGVAKLWEVHKFDSDGNLDPTPVWEDGDNDKQYFFHFHGGEDFKLRQDDQGVQQIVSGNTHADMYEVDKNKPGGWDAGDPSADTSTWSADVRDTSVDPRDPNAYSLITNQGGTRVLEMTGHNGVWTDDATQRVQFDPNLVGSNTAEDIGDGSAYFDVTGGTWKDLFDWDLLIDQSDILADFETDPAYNGGWTVKDYTGGDSFIKGNMVPEPTAMALAFLAAPVAGLIQVLRRRHQKKA